MIRTLIEPKVNEEFDFFGTKCKCVEDPNNEGEVCSKCCLNGSGLCSLVACIDTQRKDRKGVHFVKVENNEKTD